MKITSVSTTAIRLPITKAAYTGEGAGTRVDWDRRSRISPQRPTPMLEYVLVRIDTDEGVTGIGEARNAIITRTAQVVVAIGGSYGTLSEIGFALGFGVPVVGLGTWEVRRAGHPPAPIIHTATPEEAAARALALARQKQ